MSIKPIPLFPEPPIAPESILGALECSVIVVRGDGIVTFVNDSAQRFLAASASQLCGHPLDAVLPHDSTILTLIRQAQERMIGVSEYGLIVDTMRTRSQLVNVQ